MRPATDTTALRVAAPVLPYRWNISDGWLVARDFYDCVLILPSTTWLLCFTLL